MLVIKLVVAVFSVVLVCACAPHEAPQTPVATAASAAMERWQSLEREVSKLRVFLESRIDVLEGRRASLTESDHVNLGAASAASVELKASWQLAHSTFLAGDVDGAVIQGEKVRLSAREALRLVGIEAN